MSSSVVLFSLLAILCWGLGAYVDKLAVQRLSPSAVFFSRYYLMFLLLFPFLVMTWSRNKWEVSQAGKPAVLALIFSALFTNAGMYFYYNALSQGQASRVVPLCSTYPLVAFFLAVLLLNEPFTFYKSFGTLLIVLGVSLLGIR